MDKKPFDPNDHLMKIKSNGKESDYLPVQYRLVWFRQECPKGTIETEMVHHDPDKLVEHETLVWNDAIRKKEKVMKTAKGEAVFRAIIKDGNGGSATGTKAENAAAFADYREKAETGAIGRALAALGYGTQFAPEFDESDRIIDSPVDSSPDPKKPAPNEAKTTSTSPVKPVPVATTPQKKAEPVPMSQEQPAKKVPVYIPDDREVCQTALHLLGGEQMRTFLVGTPLANTIPADWDGALPGNWNYQLVLKLLDKHTATEPMKQTFELGYRRDYSDIQLSTFLNSAPRIRKMGLDALSCAQMSYLIEVMNKAQFYRVVGKILDKDYQFLYSECRVDSVLELYLPDDESVTKRKIYSNKLKSLFDRAGQELRSQVFKEMPNHPILEAWLGSEKKAA